MVAAEEGVGGHKGEFFDLGLGDEDAVEGVAMVEGEFMGVQRVCHGERQRLDILQAHLRGDEQVGREGQGKFAEGILDADLPGTDGAEEQDIVRVLQGLVHGGGEPMRL